MPRTARRSGPCVASRARSPFTAVTRSKKCNGSATEYTVEFPSGYTRRRQSRLAGLHTIQCTPALFSGHPRSGCAERSGEGRPLRGAPSPPIVTFVVTTPRCESCAAPRLTRPRLEIAETDRLAGLPGCTGISAAVKTDRQDVPSSSSAESRDEPMASDSRVGGSPGLASFLPVVRPHRTSALHALYRIRDEEDDP